MNRKQLVADMALLGVAFAWGTTFLLVQKAIDALPPYSFLFVRFALAFIFLFFIYVWQNRRNQQRQIEHKKLTVGTWVAGGILSICLFGGYALQTIGLVYTTSSKAGFITGLNVVLVPIFSVIILRIKPSLMAIAGVVLACSGLFFLAFGDQIASGALVESLVLNKGDMLVFFCTIFFALQIIFTGKYAPKYNVMLLTVIELGFVALFCLIFALFTEDLEPLLTLSTYINPMVLLALIITSVFATALAFLAQTHYQQHTTPTRVALIFAMEPIFAALIGVTYGGEVLTGMMLVGCGLILIGMLSAELPTEVIMRLLRPKKDLSS